MNTKNSLHSKLHFEYTCSIKTLAISRVIFILKNTLKQLLRQHTHQDALVESRPCTSMSGVNLLKTILKLSMILFSLSVIGTVFVFNSF